MTFVDQRFTHGANPRAELWSTYADDGSVLLFDNADPASPRYSVTQALDAGWIRPATSHDVLAENQANAGRRCFVHSVFIIPVAG